MKRSVILIFLLILQSRFCYADITVNSASQVTLGTAGETPQGTSGSPIIAPNGQLAVFRSDAPNLVTGDTNGANDVFVSDLNTRAISRLSVNAAGVQGNNVSTNPSISVRGTDGFYAAAFESDATNLGLATNDTISRDIIVRIPTLNITEVVSQGLNSTIANDDSFSPSIAYIPLTNKIRIVFSSDATNLVSNDQNGQRDIFLAEISIPSSSSYTPNTLATISRITGGPAGFGANGASDRPRISGNGQYIVFQSRATDIVQGAGVTASFLQSYIYNIDTQQFTILSKSSAGVPGDNDNTLPSVSFNGRYFSYLTASSNIITGLAQNVTRVVRFDSKTGVTTLVSSSSTGEAGNDDAIDQSISGSGRFITFSDTSTNLVAGDTNLKTDVFIKDLDTGTTARISKTATGETNANSDSTSSSALSFNSLSTLVSYRSLATNISSTTQGGGDIFLTTAALEAQPFAKGTQLEVPPDVAPSKRKTIVSGLEFKGFSSAAKVSLPVNGQLFRAQTSATTSLRYEFQVDSVPRKRKLRQNIFAKRNRVTVRKLKPGTYVSKYRVLAVKGTKTVTKSPFSPAMQFKVS